MTLGEMKAELIEDQEHMSDLEQQGLCLTCEANPQNPHVDGPVCLSCYESNPTVGCSASGCAYQAVEDFRESQYCPQHFAQEVLVVYEEYLSMFQELEDTRAILESRAAKHGTHPRDYDGGESDMSDKVFELHEEYLDVKHLAREVNILRDDIQEAVDADTQVFPDEYQIFG